MVDFYWSALFSITQQTTTLNKGLTLNTKSKDAYIAVARSCGGKATIAGRIAKNFHFPYFEMGEALRSIAAEATVIGSGKFAGNDRVIGLAKEWIDAHAKDHALFIDGIPRNREQAKWILKYLKGRGFYRHTLWISTSEEECLRRAGGRPGRKDDDPEIMREKMQIFNRETLPIRSFMQSRTDFFEIANEGDSEQVRQKVIAHFNLKALSEISPVRRTECQSQPTKELVRRFA